MTTATRFSPLASLRRFNQRAGVMDLGPVTRALVLFSGIAMTAMCVLAIVRAMLGLSLNNQDLPPALTLPVRFLHGDKDRSVPVALVAEAAATLPNASALPFSNVGHSPFEEVPEQFNAVLLEFARSVRGPVAD